MKQTLVIWVAIVALVLSNAGCPQNSHVPEQIDNALIAAQYQAALEDCYTKAVETVQTTNDVDKAEADFNVCVSNADKKYYPPTAGK